jgi:hypothetical protein
MALAQRKGFSLLLAAGLLVLPWQEALQGLAGLTTLKGTAHLFKESVVFAAKKKSKKADIELQAKLDPLLKQLQTLRLALQNRKLFSYKDLQALDSVQAELAMMAAEMPGSPLLARPLFQLAQVLEQRERWLDAYEFYSLVNTGFNGLPIAQLAEKSMKRLSTAHGDVVPDFVVAGAAAIPTTVGLGASPTAATGSAKVKVP